MQAGREGDCVLAVDDRLLTFDGEPMEGGASRGHEGFECGVVREKKGDALEQDGLVEGLGEGS